MDSFYNGQNYKYPELCIVKEEFNINKPGIVKCYIPVLMPFIKEGEPKLVKFRPSNLHLDNKEKDGIEPSENSYTANYILINLPSHVTDVLRDLIITPEIYDDIPDVHEDEPHDIEDDIIKDELDDEDEDKSLEKINDNEVKYSTSSNKYIRKLKLRKRYFFPIARYDKKRKILYAKKDQKFIAVFIGGNINNIKIIGRYDECPLHERTLSPTYLPSEVPSISQTTEHQ